MSKIDKFIPIITVIGVAVAVGIIITVTAQYVSSISKVAGQIASTLGPIAQALKQAVLASGVHSNTSITTITSVPPP